MSSKVYHCNICDCEVSIKCRNKHLKTKKHNDNLNKNNEDDNDKKSSVPDALRRRTWIYSRIIILLVITVLM